MGKLGVNTQAVILTKDRITLQLLHITNHFTVIPRVKQKPPRTQVRTGMVKDCDVSVAVVDSVKTYPSNVPWSILSITVLRLTYIVWVFWYFGILVSWYCGCLNVLSSMTVTR